MASSLLEWIQHHPTLKPHPQNRISSLCRLITRIDRSISAENPEWRSMVQALRELNEYWWIRHSLDDDLLSGPFRTKFLDSLSDTALIEPDSQSSKGRDTQLELIMAAIACRAGLRPSINENAGPDLQLSTHLRRWVVEVKRVKSVQALSKRLSEAISQIRRSQLGGAVVLDMSAAWNPELKPLDSHTPLADIKSAQRARGECLAEELRPQLLSSTRGTGVGFVIIQDCVLCPSATVDGEWIPWSVYLTWDRFTVVAASEPRFDYFEELWQLLDGVLHSPLAADPPA
jgi:hypothetical protein